MQIEAGRVLTDRDIEAIMSIRKTLFEVRRRVGPRPRYFQPLAPIPEEDDCVHLLAAEDSEDEAPSSSASSPSPMTTTTPTIEHNQTQAKQRYAHPRYVSTLELVMQCFGMRSEY